jgi:hypothetical protein
MEEATIKLLAQVMSKGVDIWKDDEVSTIQNDSGVATLQDPFCNCHLQFVEAGVKEAKIVSTTRIN